MKIINEKRKIFLSLSLSLSLFLSLYIEECIFRQQVIIQASFVKDDGTLLIYYLLFYFWKDFLLFFFCRDGKGIPLSSRFPRQKNN